MSTTDLAWFKSSYTGGSGDDCIEVAPSWHKSSYSSGGGGDCVEVAPCASAVHVRDSKNPTGPQFSLAPAAWTEFLTRVA